MLPTRMLALLSTLLLPAQLTFPLYIGAVLEYNTGDLSCYQQVCLLFSALCCSLLSSHFHCILMLCCLLSPHLPLSHENQVLVEQYFFSVAAVLHLLVLDDKDIDVVF